MGGKQERTAAEREALSVMGFRMGERIGHLEIHINKRTKQPCDGDWGIVVGVGAEGASAYVKCNVCKDTLRVEL